MRFTFYAGDGSVLTIEAESSEAAIERLSPQLGSYLGYYLSPNYEKDNAK